MGIQVNCKSVPIENYEAPLTHNCVGQQRKQEKAVLYSKIF